jgi:hypothetical protein
MIQLILYFIQLIFASICLFVNKSSKTAPLSDISEESPYQSPKISGKAPSKKKKPKRNRSAFIIFSSTKRAQLKSLCDDQLNSNEMMVKLAELWRDLPEYEKRLFHEEAEKEKVRYLQDLNEFYEHNPNEIIQNKTKKNHVKKPCSAYALYLKDTKKTIKLESPDLKMADILKVVAQRWRELSESHRSIFQQKALAEKEITKAKMSEYLSNKVEESAPSKKSPPQKKDRKRAPKTLKGSVKIEESSPECSPKIEETFSSFRLEEPALQKRQCLNVTVQPAMPQMNASFYPQPVNINMYDLDYFVNDINAFARTHSVKQENNNDMTITRDMSMIWRNSAEPQPGMIQFFSDTLDLMDFQPMSKESVKIVSGKSEMIKEEEEESSETTHMSPRSLNGRIANDMLMNILDSDSSSYEALGNEEMLWTDFFRQEKSTVDLF